jgi:tetratricopeptide (TPR) repeat protein
MIPPAASPLQRLLGEIRRRRVDRVALTYAAGAFVVLQAADLILPALGGGAGVYRLLVIAALVGFPVALLLGWTFDLTSGGLRRTDAAPEGAAAEGSPRRTFSMRYSMAITALVLMGGAVWWLRPSLLSGKVVAGADVVVVVPFRATGSEEIRLLGEGMVDLLSTNLDEVGAIRTVDPRQVLRLWRGLEDGGGAADPDALLGLGRDLQAGSVLSGSVVEAGTQVRLEAELRTVDGASLARARVDGPGDQVLGLVDSLSLRLLREVWRSREPIPDLRVSAITTSSLDAIRAYLEGEAHFRRSEWNAAAEAFERAVAEDSAFALAHFRLASAYGWSEGVESLRGTEALRVAGRLAERLPARERLLVRADSVWKAGAHAAARDTLDAYLARHPDDAEARFLLADILYHGRDTLGLSDAEVSRAFERVLEVDPTLAPALIHPIDLALENVDSAAYLGYVESYAASAGDDAARLYDLVGKAFWTDPDTAYAAGRWVVEHGPTYLGRLLLAVFRPGRADPAGFLEGMEAGAAASGSHGPGTPAWRNLTLLRAFAHGALGRFERVRILADSFDVQQPGVVTPARVVPVLIGTAGPELLGEEAAAELRNPSGGSMTIEFVRLFDAVRAGDAAGSREVLGRLETRETPTAAAAGLAELVRDARAWAAVMEGDSAAARALMPLLDAPMGNQGNDEFRYFTSLSLLVQLPSTRADAQERLAGLPFSLPHLNVEKHRVLGEAYDAAGDTAAALLHYRRYVDLAAEAEGPMAARVDSVRAAAARLGG